MANRISHERSRDESKASKGKLDWCSLHQALLATTNGWKLMPDEQFKAVAGSIETPTKKEGVPLLRAIAEGQIRCRGDRRSIDLTYQRPSDIQQTQANIAPSDWQGGEVQWRESTLLSGGNERMWSQNQFINIQVNVEDLRKLFPLERRYLGGERRGPKPFDYDAKFWPEVVAIANHPDGLPETKEDLAEELHTALKLPLSTVRDKLVPVYTLIERNPANN